MGRFRSTIGVAVVGALVSATAFVALQGDANATTLSTTYTCSGVSGDQASYDIVPGNNVQSSAQVLNTLAGLIPNFPAQPSIYVGVAPNVPATAGVSDPFAAVMVGDDVCSDVPGAHAAGMRSVLVRTGKFSLSTLERSEVKPDLLLDSVADLPKALEELIG